MKFHWELAVLGAPHHCTETLVPGAGVGHLLDRGKRESAPPDRGKRESASERGCRRWRTGCAYARECVCTVVEGKGRLSELLIAHGGE